MIWLVPFIRTEVFLIDIANCLIISRSIHSLSLKIEMSSGDLLFPVKLLKETIKAGFSLKFKNSLVLDNFLASLEIYVIVFKNVLFQIIL